MKPPYSPGHVESVTQWDGQRCAVARCSCLTSTPPFTGHLGEPHPLGAPGTVHALIADFNAHRATYVQESA